MRSYEAARGLFSFLGFCAWCLIAVGFVVTLMGMSAANQYGGFGGGPTVLMAALPGIGLALAGLISLAMVENGRASVDTAELTQQILKVSRDHLEISKQSQRDTVALQKSYAALAQKAVDTGAADFKDAVAARPDFGELTTRPKQSSSRPPSAIVEAELKRSGADNVTHYLGRRIEVRDGKYLYAGVSFENLESAKRYVDRFGADMPPTLTASRDPEA